MSECHKTAYEAHGYDVISMSKNELARGEILGYYDKDAELTRRTRGQTEREALAIVWACERFHAYLYGIKFQIVTYYQPFECLYSKKSRSPARIESSALRR